MNSAGTLTATSIVLRPRRWAGHAVRALAAALILAAVVPPASAQETVSYYHLDAVGSVRLVTNTAGAVVERHDYLPYGEECSTGPCATNPGIATGQPLRFTGKERDQETGLDYFGARYYRTQVGRFTTVDPVMTMNANLTNPQRWNRYSYSLNNPLRFKDPDGKFPIDTIWDVGNVIYDVYVGATTGNWTDLGADLLATAIPYVPAGASKLRHLNKVDDLVDVGKKLPDDALVVRGGRNSPEDLARGTGTHPSGVSGVSVESAPGKSLDELSQNIPHGQVGCCTVGQVRGAGGDVIPTSGRSPNHATMTGLSPRKSSELLTPTVANPAKKP